MDHHIHLEPAVNLQPLLASPLPEAEGPSKKYAGNMWLLKLMKICA